MIELLKPQYRPCSKCGIIFLSYVEDRSSIIGWLRENKINTFNYGGDIFIEQYIEYCTYLDWILSKFSKTKNHDNSQN